MRFLILSFLLVNSVMASSIILQPGKNEAQKDLVDKWKTECDQKNFNSCYNSGVYYAQTLNDEKTAIRYYEKACKGDLGISCFNLGGVQIKNRRTLDAGVKNFKKACDLSYDLKLDEKERSALSNGCQFATFIPKYKNLKYDQMVSKVLEEIKKTE